MLGLIIAIYGIYFVAVGYHGNTGDMVDFLGDQKGFVYWVVAIVVLYFLYEVKTTRPLVKPFIALAILSTVLMQFPKIKNQVQNMKREFGL